MTESVKHWMAVYTKPRNEKKVAERLAASGMEVYCPLQTTLRQWSDRRKKVTVPVIPSYVFVRVAELERIVVLQDPGVMNFVFWMGKPAIIKPEEIDCVKHYLEGYPEADFSMEQFSKGDEVHIIAGPFAGRSGKVEDIGRSTTCVLLESLGLVLKINLKLKYLSH